MRRVDPVAQALSGECRAARVLLLRAVLYRAYFNFILQAANLCPCGRSLAVRAHVCVCVCACVCVPVFVSVSVSVCRPCNMHVPDWLTGGARLACGLLGYPMQRPPVQSPVPLFRVHACSFFFFFLPERVWMIFFSNPPQWVRTPVDAAFPYLSRLASYTITKPLCARV